MIDDPKEYFKMKIFELENELKRKGSLTDMKTFVLDLDKRILSDIVHNVSLNFLFECLNTSDLLDIELISVILFELLSQMIGNEILDTYGDSLHKSLSHPVNDVKDLVLKLLRKAVTEITDENLLTKYVPLLVDATGCLASTERSTAQEVISMLIKLGGYKQGIKLLYSTPLLSKLKEVMTINDISRFRVYEVVAAVSALSPENLSASLSSSLMDSLISEINSSDILSQLNVLEILSTLALSNHGLTYLQESEVIHNLSLRLLKLNEEPLGLMFLPGLIEFFGNLCLLQPEYITKEYPQVLDLLFNSLETTNEVLLGVVINTFGKIGSSCNGRLVLNKHEDQMKIFFKKMGKILTSKNNSTINALNCLGELVKCINCDIAVGDITRKWFDFITPSALESVIKLAKLPFIEFRLAALAFFKSVSTQKWGTELLCNYPGMIEFLTDRSLEFNKDCKQIKFEIVLNMVQCPNITQLLSPEVLVYLKEFVKEGPFYVPVQVEMATEGAT